MNRKPSAALLCDFYKISHREMYPKGTEVVYSTWTPRDNKLKHLDTSIDNYVVFGAQAFIKKYLVDFFYENFFSQPKEDVVAEYVRIIKYTLGVESPSSKHIEELHDLGYLPLRIKALPEGTVVPFRVPTLTIQNTDPRFFWLTNYIETLASCELWQASTSATIAHAYKREFVRAAKATGGDLGFVPFQGHDFSMRGMSSLDSAMTSGMGHLLSFAGTDTIPAIQAMEYYYGADVEKELVGTSIPATEHSIQCAYGDDMEYLKAMINDVHPSGLVSIVSDGYDFWDVMTRVLPALKKDIVARDGKVVIRPDSGDPVKIICGDPEARVGSPEYAGAIELLWEHFGGGYNDEGFKFIDEHIGLIYGDAITFNRAEEILQRLMFKGFASTNVVFGIGSYTYQFNTRDTFGHALKSTAVVINGKEVQIFKNPKTDNGMKKSLRGRVVVLKSGPSYIALDGLGLNDTILNDELRTVYEDGTLLIDEKFSDIKARLESNIESGR